MIYTEITDNLTITVEGTPEEIATYLKLNNTTEKARLKNIDEKVSKPKFGTMEMGSGKQEV